jgi:hypothetical protein
MTMTALDEFKESNPHIEQVPGGFYFGDTVLQGMKKPDAGFRDILKQIGKNTGTPRHKVNSW